MASKPPAANEVAHSQQCDKFSCFVVVVLLFGCLFVVCLLTVVLLFLCVAYWFVGWQLVGLVV